MPGKVASLEAITAFEPLKTNHLVPIPFDINSSKGKISHQPVILSASKKMSHRDRLIENACILEEEENELEKEDGLRSNESSYLSTWTLSETNRSASPASSTKSINSTPSDLGGDSGVCSEHELSSGEHKKSDSTNDSDGDSSLSSDSVIEYDKDASTKPTLYKGFTKKTPTKSSFSQPDSWLREIQAKARELKKKRQLRGDTLISGEKNLLSRAKSYQRSGRLSRLQQLASVPQEIPLNSLEASSTYSSMCSLYPEEDDSFCSVDLKRPLYECLDEEASCGFAGISDIFSPQQDSTIKSAKGTVRGVKNRVRAGIATFTSDHRILKVYNEREKGKVIVYVSTLGIVRETHERCLRLRKIFWTLLVHFEERDTLMSRDTQLQLLDRLRARNVTVPHVFIEGQYLGGVELVEKLNETGELRKLLQPYMRPASLSRCDTCGGFRLLPCSVCSGSKKSVHRNNFTLEFIALKCSACDESGLVSCYECSSSE